jgi:predicted DNA-binding protein
MARITFQAMNTISLKLPDRLLERLEAESHARGTTKSALVRDCLEKALGARPAGDEATCYDLASDLAGTLKGLPSDLATHPKYMEGFGQCAMETRSFPF